MWPILGAFNGNGPITPCWPPVTAARHGGREFLFLLIRVGLPATSFLLVMLAAGSCTW
jgi:hypothetical protein